jgi:methionine-rich copper-binding protein CopC
MTGRVDRDYLGFELYDQSGKYIKGESYIDEGETRSISYIAALSGTYYIKVTGYTGNYDLAVYRAWHNAGVSDGDRSYYSTLNTARYIEDGNYTRSTLGDDYYRFTVQQGAGFTVSLTAHMNNDYLRMDLYDHNGNYINNYSYIDDGKTGIISHTAAVSDVYYVKVSGAAGWYSLSADGVDPGSETIGPSVESTDPADGVTGVPVSKTITVTFNKSIFEGTSFNDVTVKVTALEGGQVSAQKTISGSTLTIDPAENLASDTGYTVTIPAGAVQDQAGNPSKEKTFAFTTGSGSAQIQIIINGVSEGGVVPEKTGLTATVTGAELTKVYYYLANQNNKTYSIGESYSAANNWQVTLEPLKYPDGDYTLAAIGLKKGTGERIDANPVHITISTAPAIIKTSPAQFEQKVPLSSSITITFSEDMVQDTQFNSITVKNDDSDQFVASINKKLTDKILTITRSGQWSAYTRYTVTIPAGAVKDKAGNPLAAGKTFSFRTVDPTPPQVNMTAPPNGAFYKKGSAVTITATATEDKLLGAMAMYITSSSGNKRQLKRVDLLQDQKKEHTLTATWNTAKLPDGTSTPDDTYTISTTAVNQSGTAGQDEVKITVDGAPPTVYKIYPADHASGVAVTSDIKVTFTENVLPGSDSAYNSISVKDKNNSNIGIQKSLSGKILTISPNNNLANSSGYTVTIPAGAVKDQTGNTLAAAKTFTFTTESAASTNNRINVLMSINGKNLDRDRVFLNTVNLNVSFKAEVNWGGEEPGSIRYITPKRTYTTNSPLVLNVGSEFGAGGKLKVVALNKQGQEFASCEAPFAVAAPPFGPIWYFDQGKSEYSTIAGTALGFINESVSGSRIPTTSPIFGGKKVEIKYIPDISTSLDLSGSGSFLTKAGTLAEDTNYVSYAGQRVPLVEKKLGRRANYSSEASIGVDASLGISFSYDTSGKSWQYGGSSLLELEGYAQTPPYYIVVQAGPVPIPFYGRLGAGLDASNQLDLLFLNYNQGLSLINPTWQGNFELNPYGKIMIGTGAADVAALEGYGKGGLDAKFQYLPEPNLDNICTQVEAGVKVVVLCFNYSFKLWDHEWCMNGSNSMQVTALGSGEPALLSRDYLEKGPYACFNDQKLQNNQASSSTTTLSGASETLLQENVYPYSQPVIVSQNGKAYDFWLYDNPDRNSINRTQLVYSGWDGAGWSVPQAVYDDGTADFHPEAAILSDGRVLVTWENIKEALSDTATLEDMTAGMEIACAVYSPEDDFWQTGLLTGDDYPDRSPKLAAGEDGTALLTWLTNNENTLFGTPDKPDHQMYSRFDDTGWSAPQEIGVLTHPLLKSALSYDGTTGVLVWESDEDNDQSNIEDRELRMRQFSQTQEWGAETLLTSNTTPDLAPQVLYAGGQPVLFWLSDNDIVMAENLTTDNPQIAVADMPPGGTSFKPVKKDNGITLFWSGASADGSDIYGAQFSDSLKTWGSPRRLTTDDSLEHSLSGCWLDNNTYKLLYDKVEVGYTEEGMPEPGKTDLYLLDFQEGVDLALDSINISDPTPVTGTDVTVSAEVVNLGETFEENISVGFYNGDPDAGGQLIGSASSVGALAPMGTREVSVTITTPDESNFTLYAVVDPQQQKNDRNRENNGISIKVTTVESAQSSGIEGSFTFQVAPESTNIPQAEVSLWEVGADRATAEPVLTWNVDVTASDNEGSFQLTNIEPGKYDITFKLPYSLRALKSSVTVTQNATTPVDFGEITLGDTWGEEGPDNVVDVSDYSAILYSFGTVPGDDKYIDTCDLNRDGVVDVTDYSIVLYNFGEYGGAPY